MEINKSNSKHSSAYEMEMRWKARVLVCSLGPIRHSFSVVLTVGIIQQVFVGIVCTT